MLSLVVAEINVEWIKAGTSIVQAGALVVAAVWGYYKFVRGRTFARRAELNVTGETLHAAGARAIKARVTLKNTGTSDLPLRSKTVHVYSVSAPAWGRKINWQVRTTRKVFKAHGWIEAQETIHDEILIPLVADEEPEATEDDVLAYWLECRVYEQRKKPGGLRWTANAIIPAALERRELPPMSTKGAEL